MDKKPEVPINCFFQGCYNPAYEEEIHKGKEKCYRYNQLSPNDREAQQKILLELLGRMGNDVIITPPFWCDYGYNITVGDFFYSNHNMVITDGAKVTFGNHVQSQLPLVIMYGLVQVLQFLQVLKSEIIQ